MDGDFCLIPHDIFARSQCVVCGHWFRITIYGIRPQRLCIIHEVIHAVYCCDCYPFEVRY